MEEKLWVSSNVVGAVKKHSSLSTAGDTAVKFGFGAVWVMMVLTGCSLNDLGDP